MKKVKYQKSVQRQRCVSEFINQTAHVTDTIITTDSGSLQKTWKVRGVPFDTKDPIDVHINKEQLNTVIRSIGDSGVTIMHHMHTHEQDVELETFDGGYASELNARYAKTFTSGSNFRTDHYYTLVYRPVRSNVIKWITNAGKRTIEEMRNDRDSYIEKMEGFCGDLEASLDKYGLQVLGMYEKNGVMMSSAVSFLNFLVSNEWQECQVPRLPIKYAIGSAEITPGKRAIAITIGDNTHYAKCIELKDPPSFTHPGMWNNLMAMNCKTLVTQSFKILDRYDGLKALKRQKGQLQSADDSVDDIDSLAQAINDVKAGQYCMGEYHLTIMTFDKTVRGVTENAAAIMAMLKDGGTICALSGLATDAAYYAQVPTNEFYRPRMMWVKSKNFSSTACMHNLPRGKQNGNPWGGALTVFDTPSRHPYHFSFHATPDDGKDYFGTRRLSLTVLIAQSGSGKSVLLNFLQKQALRYGVDEKYSSVTFDIDQAAKKSIEKDGGMYLTMEKGKPTGFNPFQMEPTDENILFLIKLVKMLVGGEICTADQRRIDKGVRTMMKFPRKLRRLSILLQNMTQGTTQEQRENSLHNRLADWCYGDGKSQPGRLHWVLDCPEDQIDLTTHDHYGFDGTAYLEDPEINGPVIFYLLQRVEPMIDGRRFILWMDEGFQYLKNKAISDYLGDKIPKIRKANGVIVFATQSPGTVINSDISRAMIEQSANLILGPNPQATRDDYIQGLKLSESEYDIITNLGDGSRTFLIKSLGTSVQATLNLEGMDQDLQVLSSSGRFDK